MAKFGISRPQGVGVERAALPEQGVWRADLLSGHLVLALEIPIDQYVSPGTGRLLIDRSRPTAVLVQEVEQIEGKPVIPGTGIKGAVRTHYELLSKSCDPHHKDQRCTIDPDAPFEEYRLCEACSLFGALGWSGRIWLSDATESVNGGVRVATRKVPVSWPPHEDKTGGEFRFYDLGPAKSRDRRTGDTINARTPISRQAFGEGSFKTKLSFRNATPVELGRVLYAIGYDPEKKTDFLLRLGALKFHGKGGVLVRPVDVHLHRPLGQPSGAIPAGRNRTAPDAEGGSALDRCVALCKSWQQEAMASPWGEQFGPTLAELAENLKRR